jgi:DNA-binding GntR family transcriptional regulator
MTTSNKLRDQAYDAFMSHLVARRLLPGQFISQRELALLTNMSLASVREIIPRLEAEGMLKAISQRGLQIVRIDLRMVCEAFQLREFIETNAIAAFVHRASDAEIDHHVAALDDLRRRAAAGLSAALLEEAQETDWALHDAFVTALDNSIIADLHRVNSVRIRMIAGERIGLSAPRFPIATAEHQAILDALSRRDEAGARSALIAHLASSRRRSLNFGVVLDSDETALSSPSPSAPPGRLP